MSDIHAHTAANRRAWDEIAEVRHSAKWPDASFFAQGGTILDQRVLDAAGDVYGKRLLHLQCATGEETLSWSVAGAEAIGVDISERQIELAERKAAEAQLSCRFVASDIYSLPTKLQDNSFDIAYTGGGVLGWLPDIKRWGEVIAASLRPSSRFVLFETHPMAACLSVENDIIHVVDDYFGRHEPVYGTGWRHFEGGENAKETKVQFSWPLGDVVTALAQAGMIIERLEEFPTGAELHLGDRKADEHRLPGEFLLTAHKQA